MADTETSLAKDLVAEKTDDEPDFPSAKTKKKKTTTKRRKKCPHDKEKYICKYVYTTGIDMRKRVRRKGHL
jgi:hypothetical protein